MFKTTLLSLCLFIFLCVNGQNIVKEKFIIDNDAGGDDAMAIFLALLYEKHFDGPKLVALTTGNGNTAEDNVYQNDQRILKLVNRQDVPIYRGSKKSLIRTPEVTDYFGKDGLGDSGDVYTDLVPARDESAVLALIEYSKKYKGELTVITIGSLTNVALAVTLDPDFLGRLKNLYIGAGHIQSEANPDPEFNAQVDVEAYHIIAKNATADKVTMFPFSQVKEYLNFTKDWRTNVLGAIETEIIKHQNKFEKISMAQESAWQALDPAVIGLYLRPDLVQEYKYSKNDIIICGNKRGIVTNEFVTKENANVRITYSIKTEEYRQFLLDVFKYDADSPVQVNDASRDVRLRDIDGVLLNSMNIKESLVTTESQTASTSKFIIDNDAGGDDAMAIFLGILYEMNFDGPKLVALTTGNGNAVEDNVCRNNQRILKIANRQDIPIYRGSKRSIIKTASAASYYGIDGLGDSGDVVTDLVPAKDENAVLALIEYSKIYEGDLTVVTIGSLTNIATAILMDPDFLGRLKQLYVGAGHIHSEKYPTPEFNARVDAEAYHIVAKHATPDKVTVVPFSQVKDYLNYTMDWRINVLGGIDTDIMKNQNKFEKVSMSKDGEKWPKLDPAVIGLFIRPDLVKEYKYSKNDIVICGEKRGLTTHEIVNKENANVRIVYSAKTEEYKQFLLDVFKHGPKH